MKFNDGIKDTLTNEMNRSLTENGALGCRTTGNNLLDLHFNLSSLRYAREEEIIAKFVKAYYEDKKLALKWLFYARDIRGGLGERRLFRVLMHYLVKKHQELPVKDLLPLIPEYGRYDDIYTLLDTAYEPDVLYILKLQLEADMKNMALGRSVSLLAKWMPSVNTSSKESRTLGRYMAKNMGMGEKEYRKALSTLRQYLDVVEVKMSAGNFEDINYETVPSRANLLYRDAFLRHDETRRAAYLGQLKTGEKKMNARVLYPHDIVHAYENAFVYDEALEQLWRNLPDTVREDENTLVVADGSGSMSLPIGGGNCSAPAVANALAIYYAERSRGQFHNQYITFSENPQLVDLSKGANLFEKLEIARAYNEVANTNIYRVFQLILKTAVKHLMRQKDLPAKILIISDMEFDECAVDAGEGLFQRIGKEYASWGYHMPRLVFWNFGGRTGAVPVKENKQGVALVSGFSPNVYRMVLSGEMDPFQCLKDVLNGGRYASIDRLFSA